MAKISKPFSIAVVTCRDLPDWEIDDHHLYRALEAARVSWSLVVWDDPTVNWTDFEMILLRTTWDYTSRPRAFESWVRNVGQLNTLVNPHEIVLWNLNKTYLADLSAAGVPVAPTCWIESGQSVDLAVLMTERGWSKAFIKPQVGATARLTLPFSHVNRVEAQAFIDEHARGEGMMIQPYLQRVETDGELSLIFFGGDLSHCVRKVPVAGDYRVQDDFGASDFRVEADEDAISIGLSALEVAQRVCGIGESLVYARVDFLRGDNDEYFLNELELVEPSLFFRHCPTGADALVRTCVQRLASRGA